jgi:hypothetical protein
MVACGADQSAADTSPSTWKRTGGRRCFRRRISTLETERVTETGEVGSELPLIIAARPCDAYFDHDHAGPEE